LRRAPEVIDLADPDAPAPSPALVGAGGAPRVPVAPSNATGDGPPLAMIDRFVKWYRGGMEVLAYNPDAARAYFAVDARKALAAQAGVRYGRAAASALASLEDLFQLYPHPLLIRDLWMMAEDARIEACLKAEYPGLRRDMAAVAREEVARRSLTHGMSVRELVVELLLQMSAGDPDEVRVPDALADVVERAWALLQ